MRWSRWGVLLASLLVALVLVLPTWFGYVGALDASQIVARGQGQAIEEGIVGRLRGVRGPPDDEDLAEILEALSPSGLRYLEMTGRQLQSVGQARVTAERAERPGPGAGPTFTFGKDRVRMETSLPPPRGPRGPEGRPAPPRDHVGGRPGPPPHDFGGNPGAREERSGPPPPGEARRGPRLIIEFDSGSATQLVARARTSLIINSTAAVALLIASWFAFLWMRRQERGELARARERHLATLGEMSAILAHEIRNPLTSLKGHAQLLAESLEETPEKQEKAKRVVKEAIRLETLTTDLLDFVRTGKIRPQLCDPGDLLKRACAEVGPDNIVVDIPSSSTKCMIDSDRMQQALTNLLRNATQASDGSVEASVKRNTSELVFEVRDRGPGIPPDEIEHVFDAFHTTKTRGTGLGLAVVRRIVELHKGRVSATNHEDGGAVFRIEIPVVNK